MPRVLLFYIKVMSEIRPNLRDFFSLILIFQFSYKTLGLLTHQLAENTANALLADKPCLRSFRLSVVVPICLGNGDNMPITTCVFDAYGTLFDVAAAARQAAKEPKFIDLKDSWPALAEYWRLKQLQYTWLRAITSSHTDFWQVTKESLDWALEKTGHAGKPEMRKRLLALYWELQPYPEVSDMLGRLKKAGLKTTILSNGSPKMLESAVKSAGIQDILDGCLSVESVKVFKPDPKVYNLVNKEFGCSTTEVLFVSSNGWDVAGAAGYGFNTVWVNRANEPVDRLPWTPQKVLPNLKDIPKLAGIYD
jgi:2-haloacid dehalogenase